MSAQKIFWLILLLVGFCIAIDLPKNYRLNFKLWKWQIDRVISSPKLDLAIGPIKFKRDLDIKQGLDLQGGTQLVLEADMQDRKEEEQKQALEGAKNVVSRRVDLYGVVEPVIQTIETEGKYRILVELPGIKNIDDAIDLIGKTAQLDFRELPEDKKASPSSALISDFKKTGLSGSQLKKLKFNLINALVSPL